MSLRSKIEILVFTFFTIGMILVGVTGFIGFVYITLLAVPCSKYIKE